MLVDGMLPPGRLRVTVDELREHFVDAFPDSSTRGLLFHRWLQYREVLVGLVPLKSQWIDGSFVTSKRDPGDIDLVNVFDGPELDQVPPERRAIASMMLKGSYTRAIWGVDAYVFAIYPDGDQRQAAALSARGYWDWWLGRVRGDENVVKGYLEVVV